MTSKIIRLESVAMMDVDENRDAIPYNLTRLIVLGSPYDGPHYAVRAGERTKIHSDRDVVKIEYARNVVYGNQGAYIVTLKDGHELRLPEYAFIAETVEVED